jgi:hypothetical protein
MSAAAPAPDLARARFVVTPVLHGTLESAVEVHRRLLAAAALGRDVAVAVELPETCEAEVLRAVRRLPRVSVVHYQDAAGRPVYLLVEPTDASCEALRFALERGWPAHCVDRDVDAYPQRREAFPDAYAAVRIGYDAYVAACERALGADAARTAAARDAAPAAPGGEGAGEVDLLRERTMAFHALRLAEGGDPARRQVHVVTGIAHAARLRALLEGPAVRPLGRTRRAGVKVAHLAAESAREVLSEPPFVNLAFEQWRTALGGYANAVVPPDRVALQQDLVARARAAYQDATGDEAATSAVRVLFRFARNYALVSGRLVPDLFELLVAARGCVDGDFAYELWELATRYAPQEGAQDLPELVLRIEDLSLGARHVRFERRLRRRKKSMLRLVRRRPREARPGEWKEEWRGWSICSHPPEDLVLESYAAHLRKRAAKILSEHNARVEPFATSLLDGIDVRETLRHWHEARIWVREERVVQGKVGAVIVVFDEGGEEDSEDGSGARAGRHGDSRQSGGGADRYDWTMTWQGEHENESDQALYATSPGEQLAGPGISRCEYGGFLLTYPPGRMFGVWEDTDYDEVARTRAERLLLAALDYNADRFVLYIAARPPRSWFQALAGRLGQKLLYLPIGQLSPVTLKRIRVFHVLDGRHVRGYAPQYIL